jgi:hypothetical protein
MPGVPCVKASNTPFWRLSFTVSRHAHQPSQLDRLHHLCRDHDARLDVRASFDGGLAAWRMRRCRDLGQPGDRTMARWHDERRDGRAAKPLCGNRRRRIDREPQAAAIRLVHNLLTGWARHLQQSEVPRPSMTSALCVHVKTTAIDTFAGRTKLVPGVRRAKFRPCHSNGILTRQCCRQRLTAIPYVVCRRPMGSIQTLLSRSMYRKSTHRS